MISHPTRLRQVVSAALLFAGFVFTLFVKLADQGNALLGSEWLVGVWPNFICAALVPLVIFWAPRRVNLRGYLGFLVLIACCLAVFEIVQVWLPDQTYDPEDLWATGLGALVALPLGLGVFALSRHPVANGS